MLAARIQRETIEYRKGAEVEYKDGATHIYAMPPTPDRARLVDVHFINVGFTEAAADKAGFETDLRAAAESSGEFADVSMDRLAQGPSYIELGGWIGSQDLALRLLALGEHYGVWRVVTPEKLGMTGASADRAAGAGFVMCTGWHCVSDEAAQ